MLRRTTILAAALLLATGGIAHAEPTTLRLPTPTGPHRLGTTMLHLVDRDRTDPWNGTARELMVTVFYPASTVRGYPVAPQLTPAAAAVFKGLDPVYLHPELPDEGVDWAATATHSHTGAPAQPIPRPVLLYSPGGADPRTIGTGLAEELASHGNVVVTIDHPGETSEVEFPGGRVRTIDVPGDPRTDPELFRTMLDTRVADTRFVLDRLVDLAAGRNPDAEARALPENLGRALDLRRVGAYGHSAGGATVAEALHEDRRIDAAVNMEGYLDYLPEQPGQEGELLPVARDGVDRPLLLLGTDGFRDERFERTWAAMLAHRGCTRREQLDNATHWVFTDYGAQAPQLQDAGLMSAEDRAKLVGAIDPAESVPAIRDHVRTFFARHLPR
ncbi:hypothetical protein SAMN05216215_107534 [Saccharopolyspora shandongensis]|uniref:Platelet-activating factor acetylhydrolase n=1 Tax=Saccharopolyspora shandongensis TaxID=418495 RepID=A0A1H3T6N8_9PSEU|nr:alpha/beta hydrolase [Saccharopolyspora shandongensis]SDZ45375.1 hypothetical protein SAMN05216215_107534 [Saccharopolyspora shandongensis]